MEIVKDGAEEATNKDVVTQEMVDQAKAELDQVKVENKKKVYGLDVKNEDTKNEILSYLDTEIAWESTQAFGVPKVYDALSKEDLKDGKVYLGGLEVEALAFYLSKGKGKGKASAERWIRMNDAITVAYELRARDNQRINNLEMKLNALENAFAQGIGVELDNAIAEAGIISDAEDTHVEVSAERGE